MRPAARRISSALGLCALAAGCSKPVTGELLVALQSDMAPGKDIDQIQIQVLAGSEVPYPKTTFTLGDDLSLPATLGLIVSDDPSKSVSIRARVLLQGGVRVEQTLVTTIPANRRATLWMPLDFLCRDATACPAGQTCVAGACRDDRVDSSALPDYVEAEVLRKDACFDVARCFRDAAPVDIDDRDCTLADAGDVNLAIASEGEGFCGATGCFVALDAAEGAGGRSVAPSVYPGSERGWSRAPSGRIKLPEAVCAQRQQGRVATPGVVAAKVTAACPRKVLSLPPCGPSSTSASGPVVLASYQRSPASLAVSDGSVFWTEQGSPDRADGAVKRVAVQGGAPEVIAKAQAAPRGIAVATNASKTLFWANRGILSGASAVGAALMQREPNGIVSPLPFSMAPSAPEGIAVSDQGVFWTEFGAGVYWLALPPSSGAQRQELQSGGAPYAIAVDGASNVVCWTDYGTGAAATGKVSCRDLGASKPPVVLGDGQITPQAIAMERASGGGAFVFWANQGDATTPGEILRGATQDGSHQRLAENQAYPDGIAIDRPGGNLYWTTRGDGSVWSLPKDAAPDTAPTQLASGQRHPGAIAVDADAIYWINEGSPGRADGAVVRLAKP